MRSDKIKSTLNIIKKNCFLPLATLVFSFINVISCFAYPLNYASNYEIVANDIAGAKVYENTGLVKFELHKVEEDYNYLNSVKYYFDRIDSLNRKGKSFVTYDNYQTIYDYGGEDIKNLDIDYSVGFVDATSFSKLDFTINTGSMNPDDYSIVSNVNHCFISNDYFNALKGEGSLTKEQVVGKKIRYLEFDFIVDGVVNNSSFPSNLMHSKDNKFIAFRYARINSKTAPYKAHMFFNKRSYYDNYSIMKDFLTHIYRIKDNDHVNLVVPNNQWIVSDIDNFRSLNGNSDRAVTNINIFVIMLSISILFGIIFGYLSLKVFKLFKTSKHTFFTIIISVFAYFAGLFIFGFAFNRLLLSGIHINTFSSFGVLFAIVYAFAFFLPVFAFTLFAKEIIEKELERKPLVSVVIPVYNGSNYLASAIFSVLSQSYKNIELIIVNDGSNDNDLTERIALSFVDDRIHYFKKKNGGVASALNFGIEKAGGEYICWLSHDDILPKDKILNQLLQLQEWGQDEKTIPYSDNVVIDEHGYKSKKAIQYLFRVNTSGANCPADYFKLRRLIFSSLLVPTAFFNENKFVSELLYSQDTFMFFQMLKSGYKLKYSNYGYTNYRVHSKQGSFTRNDQFVLDTGIQHKFFLEYFNETKDKKFINRCLLFYAKRLAGFKCYKELYLDLLNNRCVYGFSKLTIIKSKIRVKISSILYYIKRKVLGR